MPKIRLLAMLTLALGGNAMAAPRYPRPDIKIDVVLSERTRPYLVKPGAIAQPAIGVESVVSVSWMTNPGRIEQQQILEQLIANTPDQHVDEKSDYYFRLGELYAGQMYYWRDKAIARGLDADAVADAAQKAKLRAESAVNANKAKDFMLKAVKVYKALTDNDAFRNYPKLDMALFSYGYVLQSSKYMKEARMAYDRLLKNYPNSKFVPEAHLAFGDYYFEANQLADAEARYKMVLKFPRSSVYGYALYKLGWIHLNLQRYQEALETFFQIAQQTKNDAKQAALHRAALKDFVRAYAEVGKADKALPAFQRVDATAAIDMVEMLAELYLEQGKLDRSAYIHQELMRNTPASPRVCDWQYRVARGTLSMPGANNADKVREIENLARLANALDGKGMLPATAQQECRANAMALSLELARAYHAESQSTRNPDTLGYAVSLYDAFVKNFPTDPKRPEAQYQLAEARWQQAANERNPRVARDRWMAAADAFTELARADKSREGLASRVAVLAYVNADQDPTFASNVSPALTPGRPQPSRALTGEERRTLDAIAAFAATKTDARDVELGALRFIEANIYRRANYHDKAAAILASLVTTHPNEPFAEAAYVILIDSLILTAKYNEMLQVADKLVADGAYLASRPDLARVVATVRSRSMRP